MYPCRQGPVCPRSLEQRLHPAIPPTLFQRAPLLRRPTLSRALDARPVFAAAQFSSSPTLASCPSPSLTFLTRSRAWTTSTTRCAWPARQSGKQPASTCGGSALLQRALQASHRPASHFARCGCPGRRPTSSSWTKSTTGRTQRPTRALSRTTGRSAPLTLLSAGVGICMLSPQRGGPFVRVDYRDGGAH